MAAQVKTRPTFPSCSISWPSRVSTSGRPPRLEWSPSSSPRSLRPSRSELCSPSSRWRPGDERQRDAHQSGGRRPVPYVKGAVDGGRLAGGVHLLLPRPVDVAGGAEDGTAGRQLPADHLLRTHSPGIPGGDVGRLPPLLPPL